MPRQKRSAGEQVAGLTAAFSVQPPKAGNSPDPTPLAPEFVARLRNSLADPRPNIPAADVRAELRARHEARLKRGS